jgi:hypothetical protein
LNVVKKHTALLFLFALIFYVWNEAVVLPGYSSRDAMASQAVVDVVYGRMNLLYTFVSYGLLCGVLYSLTRLQPLFDLCREMRGQAHPAAGETRLETKVGDILMEGKRFG